MPELLTFSQVIAVVLIAAPQFSQSRQLADAKMLKVMLIECPEKTYLTAYSCPKRHSPAMRSAENSQADLQTRDNTPILLC